jgi:hypothetical protein
MEADNLMLKLLEEESMNFQEVVETCIPNRNRAHKTLTKLYQKKLIKIDPKNWRRGQSKSYSLTEQGLIKCNQLNISSINKSIKRLQLISSGLKTNPSGIEKAIEDQKIAIFKKHFARKTGDPYDLEEARDFQDKMSTPDRPLLEAFINLHEIVRHEFVDGYKSLELSSMYTVIKDGVLYLVKPEELKSINLTQIPT